jgi:uncharacterized protein YecT (DUF1311 family)
MRIHKAMAGTAAILAAAGMAIAATGTSTSAATSRLKPPLVTETFGSPLPCDPNTTIGQEGCGERKVLAADKQLNADITVVFSLLGTGQAQRDFVTAERDWATFRRADCTGQSDVYLGGSEQPVVFVSCLASEDSLRRQDLKAFYQLFSQGLAHPPKFS